MSRLHFSKEIIKKRALASIPRLSVPGDKLVLVTGNDESTQLFVEFALKREGFRVEQAFDPETALKKSQQFFLDLILLDLMVFSEKGEAIVDKLRAEVSLYVPLIVLVDKIHSSLPCPTTSSKYRVEAFSLESMEKEKLVSLVHSCLNTVPQPLVHH